MTVLEAVDNELLGLEKRRSGVSGWALAASARALAASIDSAGTSATARAACARELRETMALIAGLVPEESKGDKIDDLTARRKKRHSGLSTA